MQKYFYREAVIKRFVFVALNTEVKPEQRELKRPKCFERLCDVKSSATLILTKEKPFEEFLNILSSKDLLSFIFDWVSQPLLDVDDCNVDQLFFSYSTEKKLELLHPFLVRFSLNLWGQVEIFLFYFFNFIFYFLFFKFILFLYFYFYF